MGLFVHKAAAIEIDSPHPRNYPSTVLDSVVYTQCNFVDNFHPSVRSCAQAGRSRGNDEITDRCSVLDPSCTTANGRDGSDNYQTVRGEKRTEWGRGEGERGVSETFRGAVTIWRDVRGKEDDCPGVEILVEFSTDFDPRREIYRGVYRPVPIGRYVDRVPDAEWTTLVNNAYLNISPVRLSRAWKLR